MSHSPPTDHSVELKTANVHGERGSARVPAPRLLIVKLGAIGDVLMALPAAAAQQAAGYAIDWICSEAVAPVLRSYPWINVLAVDEPRLLRGGLLERAGGILRLWRSLAGRARQFGRYDTVATLYYDRRYGLLTWPIRARLRIGLSRTFRATCLLPGRHHTDEYHRILSGRADTETPAQLAPLPVPGLGKPPRPTVDGHPRVVLVPAGARNALRDDALRRWPIENYVELAGRLIAQGSEVVLAGGPEDCWASAHFAPLAATAPATLFADLIGSCTLLETLALLDSSQVTVTHDTGPLHLAGITSTAIVALFGPTDPHGRLPQRANTVAIWGGAGFACRPCYDGRDYAPCLHNGCMAQITPDMVLDEVLRMLKARQAGRLLPPQITAPKPAGFVQLQPGGVR